MSRRSVPPEFWPTKTRKMNGTLQRFELSRSASCRIFHKGFQLLSTGTLERDISALKGKSKCPGLRSSGPNLTFRFAWAFSGGLACASLKNARANQHSIECRRPQRACDGGGQPQQPAKARLAGEDCASDGRWSWHCRHHARHRQGQDGDLALAGTVWPRRRNGALARQELVPRAFRHCAQR